ncbi:MAG: PKD domain-containing protein [Patulibacter sp.]
MQKSIIISLLILVLFIGFSIIPVFALDHYSWTSGSYTIEVWNGTAGTTSWSVPYGVTSVEYLIVAGGGAGGRNSFDTGAGGGGAGGLLSGTSSSLSGSVTITVGIGGTGSSTTNGTRGGNSVLSTLTAYGGGSGAVQGINPSTGGSGGGGERTIFSGAGANGISGQGYAGGSTAIDDPLYPGGGGGGSSHAGYAGSYYHAGDGGNATYSSITGVSTPYAEGGGAGGNNVGDPLYGAGLGFAGIGGKGSVSTTAAGNGVANTGSGGGGGCGATGGGAGGNGAAGIVIVKYLTPILPVASFTTDATIGTAPLSVMLTDTTTNTPISWKYGAKNVTGNDTWIPIGTSQNQAFNFPVGNWSINLTTTNVAGSNISTQITHVNVSKYTAIPIASFSQNKISGQAPLSVLFTDTSIYLPDVRNWSVNNTAWTTRSWYNESVSDNVYQTLTQIFTTPGIYNITLSVQNISLGSPISTVQHDVLVNQTLVADFTGTPTYDFSPMTVSFTDTSTGDVISRLWNFGDGNTSTLQNPTNVYYLQGNKTVSLTVTSPDTTDTKTVANYIGVWYKTYSDFIANNTAPIAFEQPVLFTPEVPGSADRYLWDFGDGTTFLSHNNTAIHTYESVGLMDVTLTAYRSDNLSVTNTTTRLDYITPVYNSTYVKADFSGNPTSGSVGVSVSFTDLSAFGTPSSGKTYNWSFGDEGSSLAPYSSIVGSTSHVYSSLGTYTVKLTVNNTLGSSTEIKTNYIVVSYNQNTQTTFYSPHQVAFQVVDSNSNPIANTPITAYAIQSTLPGGLSGALTSLENAFGVPRETALQMLNSSTQYSGNTDSLGYAVVLMLSSIEYEVTVTDTSGTLQTITIMPQDSYYQIRTYNSTSPNIFSQALSSSNIYNGQSVFNTSLVEPNSSYGTMIDYVYDATGKTSGANCWWKCVDNGTIWWENRTWAYGSSMQTFSMTVPIIPYQQWKWGCTTI